MQKILQDTIQAAQEAGRATLKLYNKDYKVYRKDDKSRVTEADLIAQKIILEKLKKYNYAFLSEEKKDSSDRLDKEMVWIIDPLDGTNDFIDKTDQFAVMIALAKKQKIILSVVYNPAQKKLYYAIKNKDSYLQEGNNTPKKIKVSSIKSIKKARFVVSRSHLSEKIKNFLKEIKPLSIEKIGSTGVKMGLIAEGKADAYITFTPYTSQWDTAAPGFILEEAGGKITDCLGKDFIYNLTEIKNKMGIFASNKALHEKIINKISRINNIFKIKK
jgi:3'(2'), 5'-bisphosphate nucleotidase